MHILLLGATGQIGYSLSKALAPTSPRLTVLVRDRTKQRFPKDFRILESALFNGQAFRRAPNGIDHVTYCFCPFLFRRPPLPLRSGFHSWAFRIHRAACARGIGLFSEIFSHLLAQLTGLCFRIDEQYV